MTRIHFPKILKLLFPSLIRIAFASWALLFMVASPFASIAQMFSVERVQQRSVYSTSAIYLTYAPQQLDLTSGLNTFGETNFAFDGPIYGLNYENENILLTVGFGNNLGDFQSSYFNASIALKPYIALIKKKRFEFNIPVLLKTDFIRLRTGVTFLNDELVQNVGMVGGGLNLTLKPFAKWRLEGSVIREVGFLTRRTGTSGGRHLGYQLPVRLYGSQIFGKLGLSLLYTHSFSNFDTDGGFSDYDFTSNRFGVGVSF